MFPQLPFSFCNSIAFGTGSISAVAKQANITSPLLGSSQFTNLAEQASVEITVKEPLVGRAAFDSVVAQYSSVESDMFGEPPVPTFYEAGLGFVIEMYDNTTNIGGSYIAVQQAIWQDNQEYDIPSSFIGGGTYQTSFSVTPDLADVDIDGDLYVDTGDRYYEITETQVLDTVEPYWTLQIQFCIKARWVFDSMDYFDYDYPRCEDANIKVFPVFGTFTSQRRAFTLLESSVTSAVLPSTDYDLFVEGAEPIDTRTITVDYPNIATTAVNFNDNLRVLYLTEPLELTGTNIDTTTYNPEKITAPLYWYWTSPTTTNNYDL